MCHAAFLSGNGNLKALIKSNQRIRDSFNTFEKRLSLVATRCVVAQLKLRTDLFSAFSQVQSESILLNEEKELSYKIVAEAQSFHNTRKT